MMSTRALVKKFDIGLFEFLFAFYPILSQYNYGGIFNLGFVILMILDIYALARQRIKSEIVILNYKPLLFFTLYIILHNLFFLVFVANISIHYFTSLSGLIIFMVSISIISPFLKIRKLINSLCVFAFVSCVGLIYQVFLLLRGNLVSILFLPFLPTIPYDDNRFVDGIRPSSFFWEPQSFVSALLVPLFICLIKKKYLMSAFIIISMMLSTSTTGIVISIVMFASYFFSQTIKFRTRLVLIIIGLLAIHIVTKNDVFQFGLEKMEKTESDNVRLSNGPAYVKDTPIYELIIGIPAENLLSYYNSEKIHRYKDVYVEYNLGVPYIYMGAFWESMILYGFIGLFLFLNIYYKLIRENRMFMPFCIASFATFFSVTTIVNVFDLIIILSLLININGQGKYLYRIKC